MMVSYIKKGDQIEFLNTYSNYSSAINGFSRDVRKLADEKGVEPLDLAGNEVFLASVDFICSIYDKNKKCGSIKEMEKWLANYINYLEEVNVKLKGNEFDDMSLKVLNATQPVFFAQAQTDSEFVYDMFKKKTKNWMMELVR